MPNSSLLFDGEDDVVNFGSTVGNFGDSDFTVEFWVNTTSEQSSAIFSKRPVCDHASFWEIGIVNGRIIIEVDQDDAATNYNYFLGSQVINDGNWHHVAVVRDDENVSILIDGQLDKSQDGLGTAFLDNTADLLLGDEPCAGVDGSEEFEGLIDEVRLWSVALTEEEIQTNAEQIQSGNEDNLVGYWRFDEINTANTVEDLSVNNNNGTLENGTIQVTDNAPINGYFFDQELVYFEDFENGLIAEWSSSQTEDDNPGIFTSFSGRFNNDSQTLTLPTVPGEVYSLTFDLYAIDSWDGSNAINAGPDYFIVEVDGTEAFNEPIANNSTADLYSFRLPDETGSFGFNPDHSDAIYRDISITFQASGETTEIRFLDDLVSQGLEDESWGIDNVEIVPLIETSVAAVEFSYDPLFNQLTSYTDELGRQTLYEVDPNNGNILSTTQVVGEVGGDDDLLTLYTYTEQGLLDLLTDPLGRTTDYDYDAFGNLIQITYAQGTGDEVIQQFEYDVAGNVTAFTDENGNRTEFEYDLHNRLITVIEADPDGNGPLTSPVTTYTYDEVGNELSMTDARGNITEYTYDQLNRLSTEIDALGGEMAYEYDSTGNLVAYTDELGHSTEYGYDSRNRLTEITDPEGNQSQFGYDDEDNLVLFVDALGNPTQYIYDGRDRLVQVIDSIGGVYTYAYDAADNVITEIDENGHATDLEYDDLNRLINVTDPLGGEVSYTYDRAYNLTSYTDELGRSYTFTYDDLNRLTTVTDPLDGIEVYDYDSVGNLIEFTDELDRTTTFSYDNLNRLVSVADPLDQITSYGYDAEFNLTSYTDGLGNTTQYAYDELNRLVTETNALGDTFTTTYDAVNNVIAVTDELGRTTTFTYDDRDLQTSITDPLGHTTTVEYDEVGFVTAVIDPLGQTTTYSYDSLYRQTSHTDALGYATTYTYDPASNLLSITDPEANTTTYTYDELNRLITDTNELGDTRTYSYDTVDNFTGMVDRNGRHTNYVYDELDRQTQEVWLDESSNALRTFDYTYDAASQLIAVSDPDSAYTYTYDAAGRLTSVDNAGTPDVLNVVLDYTYDAAN